MSLLDFIFNFSSSSQTLAETHQSFPKLFHQKIFVRTATRLWCPGPNLWLLVDIPSQSPRSISVMLNNASKYLVSQSSRLKNEVRLRNLAYHHNFVIHNLSNMPSQEGGKWLHFASITRWVPPLSYSLIISHTSQHISINIFNNWSTSSSTYLSLHQWLYYRITKLKSTESP